MDNQENNCFKCGEDISNDDIDCVNICPGEDTIDNFNNRNIQCKSICGSTLKNGFSTYRSICKCNPRTKIKPCNMDDEYERKKCFLENGYQYWEDECAIDKSKIDNLNSLSVDRLSSLANANFTENFRTSEQDSLKLRSILQDEYNNEVPYPVVKDGQVLNSVGGPSIYVNGGNLVGCDFTFPYYNNIELKYNTPFRGNKKFLWNRKDGGYIKYDILTNNISHISMNPRQGGDKIGNVGILRTPSIDNNFKAERLDNLDLNINVNTKNIIDEFTKSDLLLESKLDNQYINITSKSVNMEVDFDMFECQYGYIRMIVSDFNKETDVLSIFGLGPLIENSNSLDWTSLTKRRCNQCFGSQQAFGIHGSHWPVMYVMKYNKVTNDTNITMVYFDHFRKVEYFFEDLNTKGIIRIRSREPEFRFYVTMNKTILGARKNLMKIIGSPLAPVKKNMGLWIARFGYKNWKEVEEDIELMRKNNYPVDGFILDIYWMGHIFPNDYDLNSENYKNNFCYRKDIKRHTNELGKFTWDRKAFPEPEKYQNELADKYNYGITLIEEPVYTTADSKDFSYMYYNNMIAKLENGTWASPEGVWNNWVGQHAAMTDWTNPKTGEQWFKTRIQPLLTNASYAWWNDLGEPEVFNQAALYYGIGQLNNKGEMMHEFHQAPDVLNYSQFLCTKYLSQEYKKNLNKRYNVLVRTGTCGIQRYGGFMWPGDEGSNNYNNNSVKANSQILSLCGLDFSTSDTGGFVSDRDKIYSAWYANSSAVQYNIKPHKWMGVSGKPSSIPVINGNNEANFLNTIQRYLFSPYYYSSAMDISNFGERQGEPWTTTLYFFYQNKADKIFTEDSLALNTKFRNQATNVNRQMVGKNLLFVLYSDDTKTSEDIILPPDTLWFEYRKEKWVSRERNSTKGHTVELDYKNPLCPLFIRNNTITPMRGNDTDFVNMRYNDKIDYYKVMIVSYDGQNAEPFTLYLDDGISLNKPKKCKITYRNGVPSVICDTTKPCFEFYLISKNGIKKLSNNTTTKSNNVTEFYKHNNKPSKEFFSMSEFSNNSIYIGLGVIFVSLILICLYKNRK